MDRLRQSDLDPKDTELLISIVGSFLQVRALLSQQGVTVLRLIRQIFGVKTEKMQKKKRMTAKQMILRRTLRRIKKIKEKRRRAVGE